MNHKLRIYLTSVILTFSTSCNLFKATLPATTLNLSGEWEETWGVGEKTNVDYSDVYTITINSKGKPVINCPKRKNYQFEQTSFDGKKLLTHLIIKDLKFDAGDSWVDYTMELEAGSNNFKGSALTKAGKKASILWKKVK
jgi:hypothetical protein